MKGIGQGDWRCHPDINDFQQHCAHKSVPFGARIEAPELSDLTVKVRRHRFFPRTTRGASFLCSVGSLAPVEAAPRWGDG
jgi:hypothetical protein